MGDRFELEVSIEGDDSEGQQQQAIPPLLPSPERNSRHEVEPPLPEKFWSIFRVPAALREVDETAYKPRMVSVGPFHFRGAGLEAMEVQKQRFLDCLLSHRNQTREDLKTAMRELEMQSRECYSEQFPDITSDDFVGMMVLDGCFVVELLRLSGRCYKNKVADDPIFGTRWMPHSIGRDLLMLENQLPLFVLQKLFDMTKTWDEQQHAESLHTLALQFFEPLKLGRDAAGSELQRQLGYEREDCPHLLALFQSSFRPPTKRFKALAAKHSRENGFRLPLTVNEAENEKAARPKKFVERGWIHSAKLLKQWGVRFQTIYGRAVNVEFSRDGVLKMPTLFINDHTRPVMRNLLAFEQSFRCKQPWVSSLAVFLCNLVDAEEDVAVLKEAGIVRAPYGDQETVVFLKSLMKEPMFNIDDHFQDIIDEIRSYTRTLKAKLNLVLHTIPFNSFLAVVMNLTVIYFTTTTALSYNNSSGDHSSGTASAPAPAPAFRST